MLRRIPKQRDLSPRARPVALHARLVRRRKAPLHVLRLTLERDFDGRTLAVRAQYSDLQPRWITGKPGNWRGPALTRHWILKLDAMFNAELGKTLL